MPDTGAAPALVTAVDGLPGTELLGERAPGGAGLDHPEHARQQCPVVAQVTAQRGQERHNPLPLGITEFEAAARRLPEGVAPRVLRCDELWEIRQ